MASSTFWGVGVQMPFISMYANGYTYARRSKHRHLIIIHVYFLVHADTPKYYACMYSRTQRTLARARARTHTPAGAAGHQLQKRQDFALAESWTSRLL